MKLIRWGDKQNEKPGIFLQNKYYNTEEFGEDYDRYFFESGGLDRLAEFVKKKKDSLTELPEGVRIAAPVSNPSKIVCIGLNYKDHATETGLALPAEPIIFFKSTTALSGPFDNIVIPKSSEKTDWEVELAVVISKKATYVDEGSAMDYVAGYCLHNDLSERAFQIERGGQWVKGKSCDTFAPLGPWLVTTDEIKDVNNLRLWLTVNGNKMQDGNTSNLVFQIPFLISYISQFMTLLPGDIISTGTPAGVGLGMKPPVFLRPGDVVELGIEGLGASKQICKAYTTD